MIFLLVPPYVKIQSPERFTKWRQHEDSDSEICNKKVAYCNIITSPTRKLKFVFFGRSKNLKLEFFKNRDYLEILYLVKMVPRTPGCNKKFQIRIFALTSLQ
jgi:hypothetical protein